MVSCPQCQADSFLNPNIKILLSPCYHKICTTCLQRLFPQGHGKCPECGVPLRKSNFFQSTFEDVLVEKECQIRKKLALTKKSEKDFNSQEEYYNYLEEFEDKVFLALELDPLEEKKFFDNESKNKVDEGKRKRSKLFTNTELNRDEVVVELFNPLMIESKQYNFVDVTVPKCFKVDRPGSLTEEDIMQMAIDLVADMF